MDDVVLLCAMDASWGCHGTCKGQECNTSSGISFTSCAAIGHGGPDLLCWAHIQVWLICLSPCRVFNEGKVTFQTCWVGFSFSACQDLIIHNMGEDRWVHKRVSIVCCQELKQIEILYRTFAKFQDLQDESSPPHNFMWLCEILKDLWLC